MNSLVFTQNWDDVLYQCKTKTRSENMLRCSAVSRSNHKNIFPRSDRSRLRRRNRSLGAWVLENHLLDGLAGVTDACNDLGMWMGRNHHPAR